MADGGVFWVLMAVIGVTLLGGSLALSMARESKDEAPAASDEPKRRVYAEEARDVR